MQFSIGDEITFSNNRYIIMEDIEFNDKHYFLLSTTEKPITGDVVEYKIENDRLLINDNVNDDIKKEILLRIARDLKIIENE